MSIKISFAFALIVFSLAVSAPATADENDELVRLPGQGEINPDVSSVEGLGRLIPGGGLLLSFDMDQDGQITRTEVESGIAAAFTKADANEDGRITPLEQIRWSETLPTRDVSLANPARFDPNLDRSVRTDEFSEIIQAFAALHANEATGTIPLEALKAKPSKKKPSPRNSTSENAPDGQRPGAPSRGSSDQRQPPQR